MYIESSFLKNLESKIGRSSVILKLEEYLNSSSCLTTKEQQTIANYVFISCTRINERDKQAIFKITSNKYKRKFISYDIGSRNGLGSHKGGIWKVASTKKSYFPIDEILLLI